MCVTRQLLSFTMTFPASRQQSITLPFPLAALFEQQGQHLWPPWWNGQNTCISSEFQDNEVKISGELYNGMSYIQISVIPVD